MPLVEMLQDINNVLNARVGKHLTAVDATDIGNLIGKTVVAGNVRRSAEMSLGSADDDAFITMKQDQKQLYHHRWASNNSVAIDTQLKPTHRSRRRLPKMANQVLSISTCPALWTHCRWRKCRQ